MPVFIDDLRGEIGVDSVVNDDSDDEILIIKRNRKSHIRSDSEAEEDDDLDKTDISDHNGSGDKPKRRTRIVSDENDETGITPSSPTKDDHSSVVNLSSSKNNSINSTTSNDHSTDFRRMFANKDLYDPEDSEDDCQPTEDVRDEIVENYEANGSSDEVKKDNCEKKSKIVKQKSPKKSHPSSTKSQRPTKKKEPQDEVDKIHSETQRLVRRSRVSLPYHKPKQRSLAEFLQRKPIPLQSIRGSTDNYQLLAKQFKKKIEEAEKFYKSSSEEEDEEEKCNNSEDKNGSDSKNVSLSNDEKAIEIIDSVEPYTNIMLDCEIPTAKKCELIGEIESKESSKQEVPLIQESSEVEKEKQEFLCSDNDSSGKQIDGTVKCDSEEKNYFETSASLDSSKLEFLNTINTSLNCSGREGQVLCDQDGKIPSLTRDDTQSAVDFEKTVVTCQKDSFLDLREIESQDIHLRIENTETFDAFKEGQLIQEEQCLSKAIRNILKTDDNKKENVIEENLGFSKECISEINGSEKPQKLCLQFEISEDIVTSSSNKDEGISKFTCFAKPAQDSAPKLNWPSKVVSIDRHGSSSLSFDEIGSQDVCLRIEDSESCYTASYVESGSSVENLLQKEIKNVISVKEPYFKHTANNTISENFIHSLDVEKHTPTKIEVPLNPSESETVKSARRSLTGLFRESESSSKSISSNAPERTMGICVSTTKAVEDPVLILEGDETRVSFEQDKSVLVCSETILHSDQSAKFNSGTFQSPIVECKSEISEERTTKGIEEKLLTPLEEKVKMIRQSLRLQKIPCLIGSPSKVIDLDDTPNTNEINRLKQRFFRHSFPKAFPVKPKQNDISIITAERSSSGEVEVKKELISHVSEKENLVGSRNKLFNLKKDLQKQIIKEREQEWSKRQLEIKEVASELEPDDKSDCGLFDEEEEEILETESESDEEGEEEEEEEEEFDEKNIKKNRVKKNAFVDDEAEVSDDLDDNVSDSDENDEESYQCSKINEPKAPGEKDAIVKNREDSNESKTVNSADSVLNLTGSSLKRTKTLDPFASQNSINEFDEPLPDGESQIEDDDCSESDISLSIPPYQPGGAVTQINDSVTEDLPVKQKSESLRSIFPQFTRHTDSLDGLGIQITLNDDGDEAELLGLCSGKFSSQPFTFSQADTVSISGKTNSVPPASLSSQKPSFHVDDVTKGSQISSLSQTLKNDENNMKLQSSLGRKLVVSSDDEEGGEVENKKQKRSHKKIQYSDDEEEDEVDQLLLDSGDDALEDDNDNDDVCTVQEVEYDSEENEVPITFNAAKDFFENEAELSESEWGSADEDEKGLDELEMEDGDDEKLDQNAVKEQLDKIHMRRLLDEDQQEIKRLQEMLLEDGEFHSENGGRQRQFRWKNLNNVDDLLLRRVSDDEAAGEEEEEEDESEWRRLRLQRETFLQEQKDSENKEELFSSTVKLKMKPVAFEPKMLRQQVKRGSFLMRSEAALARIAQIAKIAEAPLLQPKNSRNFVFATLSQDPKESEKAANKRKATTLDTPIAKKKSKMNTSRPSLLEKIG